jgi:hypothetical protein
MLAANVLMGIPITVQPSEWWQMGGIPKYNLFLAKFKYMAGSN